MSSKVPTSSLAAFVFTTFFFIASIFIGSIDAEASENASDRPCKITNDKLWAKPKFAELVPFQAPEARTLSTQDKIAALENVQLALNEVGDGATYVWYRNHGRLSGTVRPTASFKDHRGKICRHVVVNMTAGLTSQKIETIACRLNSGIWQLDG